MTCLSDVTMVVMAYLATMAPERCHDAIASSRRAEAGEEAEGGSKLAEEEVVEWRRGGREGGVARERGREGVATGRRNEGWRE